MTTQETATYQVEVTLSTEQGELPADSDVGQLIFDQMAGELDDNTGLRCIAVRLTDNLTTRSC